MPYEQDVKELAYTLDPPAWISYSGKSRDFKAVMDGRRSRSLIQAEEQIGEVRRRRRSRRISQFTEQADQNFMIAITDSEGRRSVDYSDNISLGDDINRWINEGRIIRRIDITPN